MSQFKFEFEKLEARRMLSAAVAKAALDITSNSADWIDPPMYSEYLPSSTGSRGLQVDPTLGRFEFFNLPGNSKFTAQVSWGDGTQSTATLVPQGDGSLNIVAPHAYATRGEYAMHVSITNATGDLICDHEIEYFAGAMSLEPTKWDRQGDYLYPDNVADLNDGYPQVDIGSFFDIDQKDALVTDTSKYSIQIDWGDGTQSTGNAYGYHGMVDVFGNHSYASHGTYQVKFTVIGPDMELSVTGPVTSVSPETWDAQWPDPYPYGFVTGLYVQPKPIPPREITVVQQQLNRAEAPTNPAAATTPRDPSVASQVLGSSNQDDKLADEGALPA